MNYFFYLIETLLIFFFTKNFSSFCKVKMVYSGRTTVIEFAPLTVVCVLSLLNLAGLYYAPINVILSVVIVFFVPGYIITGFVNKGLNNALFKLSMSFALSFVANAIIYAFVLMFTTTIFERRTLIVLAYLLLFFSVYTIKHFIRHKSQASSNFDKTYRFTDIALLTIYAIFFIFVILNMYPKTAYAVGSDIVRNFSNAWVAAINPSRLKSVYPWFHFEEGMVITLSFPPSGIDMISIYMPVYQTALAFLGILPITSFYVMARAYLKDIDERLPIVATGFWAFFSGFGWLKLLERLDYSGNRLQLLNLLQDASFWDIGYGGGQSTWFWYRGLTVGFTLLFLLIYLLMENACLNTSSYRYPHYL
jgi:hypothetical protein